MNKEIREAIIQQDIAALEKVCRKENGEYVGDQEYHINSLRNNETKGEFDHMSLFVKKDALSMDIGACGGSYAIKLAACTKKCIVIEPAKGRSNLRDILPPNCVFLNIAVGDVRGTAQLTAPVFGKNTSHGQGTLLDIWESEYKTRVQETEVRTIDDIVEEVCPGEQIGFIKMDVEGYEPKALKGAIHTINKWRPNFYLELWEDKIDEVREWFESIDYRGLFFFDDHLFDISTFDASIHLAEENSWKIGEKNEDFNPKLFVNNFYFIPVKRNS